MATDLICGSGGSTGAEVIQRINELGILDPRATGHLATPVSITIDDTAAIKLPCIDDVVTQRGGFEVDATNHRLVNNSGQAYESVIVSIGLNVRFPGTETMDIWAYVNGTPYASSEFTLRGIGSNKPQSVFWQSDVTLNDGDYIEIWAMNGATGTADIDIERVQFRMDADYKDNIA